MAEDDRFSIRTGAAVRTAVLLAGSALGGVGVAAVFLVTLAWGTWAWWGLPEASAQQEIVRGLSCALVVLALAANVCVALVAGWMMRHVAGAWRLAGATIEAGADGITICKNGERRAYDRSDIHSLEIGRGAVWISVRDRSAVKHFYLDGSMLGREQFERFRDALRPLKSPE